MKYLEMMEPRVLMTTILGGEQFRYTDAQGRTITATLNGNVAAELVSALQTGGSRNTGGNLVFGDIVGTYITGPRQNFIAGNGSLPVTSGTAGSATITIPGLSYTTSGDQINIQAIGVSALGQTYTFNLYNASSNGTPLTSSVQTAAPIWVMQVLQLSNTTGAATVLLNLTGDSTGSLLSVGSIAANQTINNTYTSVQIPAAAFNPIDGKFYFVLHDGETTVTTTLAPNGTSQSTSTAVTTTSTNDEVYAYNTITNSITDIGAIDTVTNTAGLRRMNVTGMTFALNPGNPTAGTLYVMMEPNGVAGPPTINPPLQPRLALFNVASDGSFTPGSAFDTENTYEGYGGARVMLTGVHGLSTLPATFDGGGPNTLFALVGTGATTHLVRLDLTTLNNTINGTAWGQTIDLYENGTRDGSATVGFAFNPAIVNPFTGRIGGFMTTDSVTNDLDFVNDRLRINQGDVFTIYTTISDNNASIVFQGPTLYTGDSGSFGGSTSPTNTGQAFLGFKGQIPDSSTNETFVSSSPIYTGELNNGVGMLPAHFADMNDPSSTSPALSDKLIAGLTVTSTLESSFNPSGNLISQVLGAGSGFNNITGLAISPEGSIVVVSSPYGTINTTGTASGVTNTGDILSFVDPTTGLLSGSKLNVHLANGNRLRGLEALAYGDVNLNGNSLLYAVYDEGTGPELGTIDTQTGVFTVIGSHLNLGVSGRVMAMAFTNGSTAANPGHESLYLVGDPNFLDNDSSESLYRVNVGTGSVFNAPTYSGANVANSGGIGVIQDSSGSGLIVSSALFDASGTLLVLDRQSGRLLDLNVTTATAGANFATAAGAINGTVAGVALDPNSLRYVAVDNMSGLSAFLNRTGNSSSIMMVLGDLSGANTIKQGLGKFLFDGTISGRVTIPGSINLLYAGWIMTGAASGSWMIGPPGGATTTDSPADNNYFKNNIYIGGDARNIISLTSIGTNGILPTNPPAFIPTAQGTEIMVQGKIGQVYALGTVDAVIHAADQNFIPNLTDDSSLNLLDVADEIDDGYQYTFKGSATITAGVLELTTGNANQAGSVFSNALQPVNNFIANFSFAGFAGLGGIDGGFAFVLQNQSVQSLGGNGTGLGYSGITHSAALEFNYDAATGGSSLGLKTGGQIGYTAIPNINIGSSDSINVSMTYNGLTLVVTLRDEDSLQTFTKSFTVNLANVIGSQGAFVGFTGGSGAKGNVTEISGFTFSGGNGGSGAELVQEEIQHFHTDGDFNNFSNGYLSDTATTAPFNNNNFADAQYLGSVRSSVPGQPDVIHLQGTLEDAVPPPQGFSLSNPTDYFAFGVLAGQTISVTVTPQALSANYTFSAAESLVNVAVYNPDGVQIATNENFFSDVTLGRAITFTADRPGAYRVAITDPTGDSNIAYDLRVTGVGDLAIGAVIAGSGQIILPGSQAVTNNTSSSDTITNPSIWADAGDVGVIDAGARNGGNTFNQAIAAPLWLPALADDNTSTGYANTGASSSDITVGNGNLRAVIGGQIGLWAGTPLTLTDVPDFNINGIVGLLQTPTGSARLSAYFSKAATGDIQVISAGGDLEGIFRTDKAIGVIRAASVLNNFGDSNGPDGLHSEFNVDADRTGSDGTIDLIDVTGDWGTNLDGGTPIVTGPGGNIRFMVVGGVLNQDSIFSNGQTGTNGEIVHAAGPVTFTDDSGSVVTLTPTTTTTSNGTTSTTTTGVLTTRVYGVRGAGGVVILNVTSSTGLTVNANAGGNGRAAEIGTIVANGAGVPIGIVNGVPTIGVTNGTGNTTTNSTTGAMNDVTLTSNTNVRVEAYNIQGGTLDHVINTTAGDILNVTATNVGVISSQANIGVVSFSSTPAALVPITTFSTVFPFAAENAGISATNIGLISAAKAIGAVRATGVIGTITANSDGIDDPNTFEGIVGPIFAGGSAANGTVNTSVSISQVNIGEGIAPAGSATAPATGIYAVGGILNVNGNNADIRGDIVSENSIGTITLNNGSIINTQIDVVTDIQMSANFNTTNFVLPDRTQNIDNPVFTLGSISITGNGGIMSSWIFASSIKNITVAPSGFGILGARIEGVSDGTIDTISAGGYGIRDTFIEDAIVNNLSVTGSGSPAAISNYSTRVRSSELSSVDPITDLSQSDLSDLDIYMNGDGLTSIPDDLGLTTGVLGRDRVQGQQALNNVSAYDVQDSIFTFAVATGNVSIRDNAIDSQFITGLVKSVTVGNNAANLEITAAGAIGSVTIGGSFLTGSDSGVTSLAQIVAKGFNGNIGSIVSKGAFGGLILAQGQVGSITVGVPGTTTTPSSGDFFGTITIGGNNPESTVLGLLKIYGSLSGGLITVTGNVNSIDVAHDFSLDSTTLIRGNLANVSIGTDPVVNGSVLSSPLDVSGNVTNATITGQLVSNLTVQGNLTKLAVNPDPATASGTLVTGSVQVGGSLTAGTVLGAVSGSILGGFIGSLTISGQFSGSILGGKTISSATLTGGMLPGSTISSGLGDILKLTVTGNLNGSVSAPNGILGALAITGNISPTGSIFVKNVGALTIPGSVAGTISASQNFTSLKVGSIASTANIAAGVLGSITTTGDLNGLINVGTSATAVKLVVGGNYGAVGSFGAPMSGTVAGAMSVGSAILSTSNLTSWAVKGAILGDIIVDRDIGTISAASATGAVITGGLGITSLTITGALSHSLVSTGLSRGIDLTFGTGDLGEQPSMADIGTVAVGSMAYSIIAAGGNITTLKTTLNMSTSTVSTGLVIGGAQLAAVLADGTPLADIGELNAARQNATLFHGSIKTATIGNTGSTMINSSVTAGVSPGADGSFGTVDDDTNASLTGGVSNITSFKGLLDGTSHLLADSSGGGATVTGYNLGAGAGSIVPGDPVVGSPTAVATPGTNAVIVTAHGTITISVTGAVGTSVSAYDNGGTIDRLDTIVISGASNSGATVTVTTTSPGSFDLGRILTTDNTQVTNFTFNGDILGDVNGGPAIWIDSSMTSFTARNLPNDGTWSGQIGGDVSKLTLNQLGPGRLRVGGRITTLTINSSVGNPLVQQLGNVNPPTFITQLAYDHTTGNTFATDGNNLLNINVTTGTVTSTVAIHSLLDGSTLNVSGLGIDSIGRLYGVASINNQNPITTVGSITSTGDQLRGMAINSQGQIYAIDSLGGTDELVTIDPTTGAETVVGTIRDPASDTFTNNVMALAFDAQDNLLALVNDRDGNGTQFAPGSGVGLARITVVGGIVRISNPTSNGLGIIAAAPNANYTAMAVDPVSGAIYAVNHFGNIDELDRMVLAGTGNAAQVTTMVVGNIDVAGATNTSVAGIGFDENDNLIGMNVIASASASELIDINATTPATSFRIDAPNLISRVYNGFAFAKTGDQFSTFGYTTDSVNGGTLYTSPGVTPALGIIAPDGGFTQLLPLSRDNAGDPLQGNVLSVAVDGSNNIFVVTDQNQLVEYSSVDGSIIGGAPIGFIRDSQGNSLNVTRVAFDAGGHLVGLNPNGDNLVQISTTRTIQNGANVALAHVLTEPGTAIHTDLTALTYSISLGKFIGYSTQSGNLVSILGTSPDTLGGLIANSFGAVTLPDSFSSRLEATGNGAGNSIDSIKLVGTGTFTGSISSVGSIGTVAGTGLNFAGSIVSHGDMTSAILSGVVSSNGVFSIDGRLTTFTMTGGFDGNLFAGSATTLTFNGSIMSDANISIANDVTTMNVSQNFAGSAIIGTVKTLKITGALASGSTFTLLRDSGALSIGSSQLGSLFVVDQSASSITVVGTLAGVVAARRSVGTVTVSNLSQGIVDVGGDIGTLNVTGNVTGSIIGSGTWIGADGIYNTADDVIYGGSINVAKVGGVFTDSLITAGVLPRLGVASGLNNIPASFLNFTSNPNGLGVADVDSAESGGIGNSSILNVTFSKPVISSMAASGDFSALVASDGIGKVVATGQLQQILRTDTPGAPSVANVTDQTTGVVTPAITLFNSGEIRVTFNEPVDSATLDASTVTVINSLTGLPVTGLTFGYFLQTAADGSTQGVLQIFSSTDFDGSNNVDVTLHGGTSGSTITDRTGLRSALLDYNQDGTPDAGGDPFGTTFTTVTLHVGISGNDNFANASVITAFPISLQGDNTLATKEAGEPAHNGDSGDASVWWSWTATFTGSVQIDTIGSNFDTVLAVYTGTDVTALTLVASDDDSGGNLTSLVVINVTQGTTYKIAVDGFSPGETGTIILNLS